MVKINGIGCCSWPAVDSISSANAPHAPTKDDMQKAQAQVAAMHYSQKIDTIESLAPKHDDASKTVAVEPAQEKKSLWRKIGDWFSKLWHGDKQDSAENAAVQAQSTATSATVNQVQSTKNVELDDQKKLTKALLDLNRELTNRLKQSAEFEEEMRKSGTNKMDHLIFFHLIKFNLDQKENKETAGNLIHADIMTRNDKNKALHKLYYDLKEEIANGNKKAKIVKWANIGTTGAIVGSIALSFATGGVSTIISCALPLLSLGKGALTIAQGSLNHKNELETGKLFMVSHDTKRNSNHIEDDLETMQLNDSDIKTILEALRSNLENHAETASLFAKRK